MLRLKRHSNPIQPTRLTRPQLGRLRESKVGSLEVCSAFFRDSKLLEDKAKIADIAAGAHEFAVSRKSESRVMRYFVGQYGVLSGVAVGLGILVNPWCLALMVPHTVMSGGILLIAGNLGKGDRFAPIFRTEDRLVKEVQQYLERHEFAHYEVTIKQAPEQRLEVVPEDTWNIGARVRAEAYLARRRN